MLSLFIITILIALAVGALAKYITRNEPDLNITNVEFIVAAALIVLVVTPLTLRIGFNVAKGNAIKYEEFWNGWEEKAIQEERRCSRDSGCHYTYDCDPYTVPVTYTYPCGENTCTGVRLETHYHDCPYANREWSFRIDTTLGSYDIATTVPDELGFRGKRVPANIPRGVPAFWQACKDRLDANDPGPVTVRKEYDNYILASDQTILRQYSDQIASLKQQRLLPPVTNKLRGPYWADKLQFVGMAAPPGDWQLALGRLNAALGSEHQGDLHMVVLDTAGFARLLKPDAYITALKAHWTSRAFGRKAISKNSIIVAIGAAEGKVVWARANTGMPVGNEAMSVAIKERLVGVPLEPDTLIGHVRREGETSKVEGGVLAHIVLNEPGFKRVSMTAEDKNDLGTGFKYLYATIQPSGWAKFAMMLIALLLSMIAWAVCLAYTSGRYDRRQW